MSQPLCGRPQAPGQRRQAGPPAAAASKHAPRQQLALRRRLGPLASGARGEHCPAPRTTSHDLPRRSPRPSERWALRAAAAPRAEAAAADPSAADPSDYCVDDDLARHQRALRQEVTVTQGTDDWHSQREGRLTASTFYQAAGVEMGFRSDWDWPGDTVVPAAARSSARQRLFYEKLGLLRTKPNRFMRHGTVTEPLARAVYRNLHGLAHAQLREDCPLWTWAGEGEGGEGLGGRAWIAGSPDAVVLAPRPPSASAEAGAAAESFSPSSSSASSVAAPSELTELGRLFAGGGNSGRGILEVKCPGAFNAPTAHTVHHQAAAAALAASGGPGAASALALLAAEGAGLRCERLWYHCFQMQGLMEVVGGAWAHLWVFTRQRGALRVELARDGAFWGALLASMSELHHAHLAPAATALQAVREAHAAAQQAAAAAAAAAGAAHVVPPPPPVRLRRTSRRRRMDAAQAQARLAEAAAAYAAVSPFAPGPEPPAAAAALEARARAMFAAAPKTYFSPAQVAAAVAAVEAQCPGLRAPLEEAGAPEQA